MEKRKYPDLFCAQGDNADGQLTACLNFSYNKHNRYIEGYKKGAELLIEQIGREIYDQDYLVYPIVFMYRQHLELQLKNIILHSRKLLAKSENGHPLHHNLESLWPLAKNLSKEVWSEHPAPPELDAADHFIGQFSQVDPNSMSFRYATTKDGEPSLPDITHINLERLKECMDQIIPFLEGVSCGVECMLEEMESYQDQYP